MGADVAQAEPMRSAYLTLTLDTETEAGRYLVACALIRNIDVAILVHRLIDVIGRDQLVLAVLDDISEPHRDAGDHKFREIA